MSAQLALTSVLSGENAIRQREETARDERFQRDQNNFTDNGAISVL